MLFLSNLVLMMLSVIIIAKNEAAKISRCLSSLAFAYEIIVLDSGSTDNTVALAKTFTNKVYETDWQGYGIQKQRALDHARGDWVLNLDADEYVTEDLQQAILTAIEANEADAYSIPVQMHFYGKPMQYSCSPSRHVRLFKRKDARYSDDVVHEKILLPEGAIKGQLKPAIMHDSFHDLSHALYKMNQYSSYTAASRMKMNQTPGFLKILIGTAWMFFRCYFLQKGFLDGKPGFVLAFLNAQGTFFRGMKCIYPDSQQR